ncbi:sterol desaturase family protein [Litoribacter populi]|uniref:sterol desaturase family protein n=1 Tax=Litoribacter populi TaxID=2598460 RepID=UPI00117DD29F|nr:sterol desaturase family protein [Litoribacter populi]
MEQYAQVLNIAMPIFLALILIEQFFEWKLGRKVSNSLDTVSSISSGLTNVIKDVLGLTVSILSYKWLVDRVAIFDIENVWMVYLITFVAIDFKGYWQHRWEHKINILWNRHVIHHSSEEFNLACGLRQTISTVFSYFAFLLAPGAIVGVPVEVIATVAPLHLFLQFWYHTRLIGNLGVLEHVIVTPSHHRVHHAVNKEYMDKNLGQIFIVWDKLFGTFQKEMPEVPCVYGISRPARTWNPIKINFQHFWVLVRDAYYAKSWWDKMRIWFMPTGWRPKDVEEKFPLVSIKDPYTYQKYGQETTKVFQRWAWVQLLFNYFLLIYLFAFIQDIGFTGAVVYGVFVVLSVYSYTELMDRNPLALYMETVKSLLGLGLIFYMGSWFGATENVGFWYTGVVGSYMVLSAGMAAFFMVKGSVSTKYQVLGTK